MKDYLREARELKEQLIAWRRQIHLNPELGMDTPKTAAFISGVLKELGYEPKTLGGGVVATLKGPCPGKTILLRAELDALPMQEESGLPFASQNPGVAHTCGHDTHAAMLLGAAQLLMEHRRELAGSVKLMFEPGEETLEGAWSMLEAGLLTDPPVDACLAIHSLINTPEPTGRLICNPGPVSASCDVFRIEIKGKGTHGSRPETGVDPINILCHLHGLLQTILTREKPQKEPAVLTICQIYAGKADNVIPEEGFMTGTVRTFNREVQMLIRRRMEEIVTGTASGFRRRRPGDFPAVCAAGCQ